MEGLGGPLMVVNIGMYVKGYDSISEFEILDEVRQRIIGLIDGAITSIDDKVEVKPLIEELILKVKDSKLATLLKEFNNSKDQNPNISAIGFRTILTLIIKERAKKINPESKLALKDDLKLEPDINEAIKEEIFDSGENRLLKRFRDGGDKDIFDNVAHKPNKDRLINKDELSDAIILLNKLLPTIVD